MVKDQPDVKKVSTIGLSKAKPGRNVIPTEDMQARVRAYAGLGLTLRDIGALIGLDKDTVAKRYEAALDAGRAEANGKVIQRLLDKALDGDTTALIWWTKARAGWHEVSRHEVTGRDGEAIKYQAIERVIVTPDGKRAVLDAAQKDPAKGRCRPRKSG